jgi:hypothetical protein
MAWKSKQGSAGLPCRDGLCFQSRLHNKPETPRNQAIAELGGLPFQRLTEALHLRGPRPYAEVLVEALRRLDHADCLEVLDLAERIVAWPPDVIRYLGADRFAPPPLLEVA